MNFTQLAIAAYGKQIPDALISEPTSSPDEEVEP